VIAIRRAARAIAFASIAACGPSEPAKAPGPTAPPLHLSPLEDLAPAAGLSWIVTARPREIAARPELAPALNMLAPAHKIAAFAERNGGVSPLDLDELVVATFTATTLYLARGAIDPARIEASFRTRAEAVDGRAIDRAAGPASTIRLWGTMHGDREQLVLFGRDALGLEIGRFGPLRAAELFAEARLKKASPALRAVPLARAAELLRTPAGDAPLRGFAPGPFEGETARALAGLVGASTAVAIAARPIVREDKTVALEITLVLTGAWKDDASAAAEKLRAAVDTLGATPLGHLTRLDHPLAEPRIEPLPDALRLTLQLDALALARGLNAAFGDAEISEIMSY
jgi:hypothetical protein